MFCSDLSRIILAPAVFLLRRLNYIPNIFAIRYLYMGDGNGIFAGYANGKYDPKAPLTREQAATILKRFKEKFIK